MKIHVHQLVLCGKKLSGCFCGAHVDNLSTIQHKNVDNLRSKNSYMIDMQMVYLFFREMGFLGLKRKIYEQNGRMRDFISIFARCGRWG